MVSFVLFPEETSLAEKHYCFELVIWPGSGTHRPVGISPGCVFPLMGVNTRRYVFKLCYPCNGALGMWKCVGAGWEVSQLVTHWAPSHITKYQNDPKSVIWLLFRELFVILCAFSELKLRKLFLLMAAEARAVLCIQGQQQFSLHLTTLPCSGSEESSPG